MVISIFPFMAIQMEVTCSAGGGILSVNVDDLLRQVCNTHPHFRQWEAR
jgi:hypothetical protein